MGITGILVGLLFISLIKEPKRGRYDSKEFKTQNSKKK